MIRKLKGEFKRHFGGENGIRVFFAPGRVNLIGEHTDYNGGHVFPCALSMGTYVLVRRRSDARIKVFSKNFASLGVIEFLVKELVYDPAHAWANYPKGIVKTFKDHGFPIETGFEALFWGDIPNSAGLSSSASIELATSVLLKGLYGLEVDMIDMVKMSQQTENEFIGVQCGIMDQFAVGMGKKDRAILLDCETLDYAYSPVPLGDASLVIANTNKRRGLADSKYNERRSECERALRELQTVLDIPSLGRVTPEVFERHQHHITRDVDRRRAKHAVYENARTVAAFQKLQQGDIAGFGQLMNESHLSLREDYEVTGKELDTLVEAAWKEGAIGSRMTGAGFGGCTISLVDKDEVSSFIQNVGKTYAEETGLTADFYLVEIGQGARELEISGKG